MKDERVEQQRQGKLLQLNTGQNRLAANSL
jgi:hypothetical protein